MKTLIKIALICLVLGMLVPDNVKAQDAHFSQFYNNPLYYNPAFAGLNLGLKARMHYKRQWVNIPGDFHNYNFSADIADRNMPGSGGLGFIINNDRRGIGYLQTMTIGLAPSVRIPLASNFVMQAAPLLSYVRKEVNWEKMIFSGQLDDIQGNVNPSTFTPPSDNALSYPDFGFGILFQVHGDNTVATIGASGYHLTEPNQSFFEESAPLARRYVGHGDIVFNIGDYKGYFKRKVSFKLNPGVVFMQQADMTLYSVGINMYIRNVYLGLWYKNESLEYDTYSDVSGMAGLMIPLTNNSRMKIMYSYDMQVNASFAFAGPSHEITLVFEFDNLKLLSEGSGSSFRGRQIIEETLECSPF